MSDRGLIDGPTTFYIITQNTLSTVKPNQFLVSFLSRKRIGFFSMVSVHDLPHAINADPGQAPTVPFYSS